LHIRDNLKAMAKIIDPDNYVPHHLTIPGIEKAKPFDPHDWPTDLVTAEEVDEFNEMIREMRKDSRDRVAELSCEPL
jgi:hypothetical protein